MPAAERLRCGLRVVIAVEVLRTRELERRLGLRRFAERMARAASIGFSAFEASALGGYGATRVEPLHGLPAHAWLRSLVRSMQACLARRLPGNLDPSGTWQMRPSGSSCA